MSDTDDVRHRTTTTTITASPPPPAATTTAIHDDHDAADTHDADFVLRGYNVGADPNASPFLQWLALEQFPTLGCILGSFGVGPVATLVIVYFLVKGVAATSFNMVLLPLLKDTLDVRDSAEYQRIVVVVFIGWTMKPLVAVLSDNVPIFGYAKRWYLFGAAVACPCLLVFTSGIASSSSSSTTTIVPLVTVCLFFCAICFATIDLLCEAIYSRLYILRPAAGTAIVSTVWGLVMFSGVVAAPVVGPLADHKKAPIALLITALLVSLCVYPFYANWFCEKPRTQHQQLQAATRAFRRLRGSDDGDGDNIADVDVDVGVVAENRVEMQIIHDDDTVHQVEASPASTTDNNDSSNDSSSSSSHANIIKQALVMGIVCPFVAISSVFLETSLKHQKSSSWSKQQISAIKLVAPLCAAVFLNACAFRYLPRKIARANLFMFLVEALYLRTDGALDFFYLADATCVPGGPHFSFSFYQTASSIVAAVFGGLGALAFHKYFSDLNFRVLYVVTQTMRIAASFFDVAIVTRYNVALGINDHAAYLIGDACIYSATYTLNFLPAVMWTAQLCESRTQSSMIYAILAGLSNFGQSIAGFTGAFLTEALGIRGAEVTTAGSGSSSSSSNNTTTTAVLGCDFSNLPMLVFLSHCVLPLCVLPLIPVLVPNTCASAGASSSVAAEGASAEGTSAVVEEVEVDVAASQSSSSS